MNLLRNLSVFAPTNNNALAPNKTGGFSNGYNSLLRLPTVASNNFYEEEKVRQPLSAKKKSYHFGKNSNISIEMGDIIRASGHEMNTNYNDSNAILLLNSFFLRSRENSEFGPEQSVKQDSTQSGAAFTSGSKAGQQNGVSSKVNKYLISKPRFRHTNHKVTIQLFYYGSALRAGKASSTIATNHFNGARTRFTNKSTNTNIKLVALPMLNSLSTYFAQLYKKEVSLVLIRLHYPYLDSYILAQYLAHNAPSNTFIQFKKTIFTKAAKAFHSSDLPSHITGIKVQISGRLITESVIPRMTVKSSLIGSFSSSKTGEANASTSETSKSENGKLGYAPKGHALKSTVIDYSKFTHKNNLGSFTIKVWIASVSTQG